MVSYSDDYSKAVYGDNTMVEYARPCPRCRGQRRVEDTTGVPSIYREADITKFKWDIYDNQAYMDKIKQLVYSFYNDFPRWQAESKGLYIWSKTSGSGKTFLASCLAKSVMMKYDIQMRFISVPDYFELLSERMKQDRGDFDKTAVYRTCPLLVLDDIGTTPNKEWYETQIFRLLDARQTNGLITIFTSNSSTEDLKNLDRVIDRIVKATMPIHFPEISIRKNESERKNREFLKRMNLIDA